MLQLDFVMLFSCNQQIGFSCFFFLTQSLGLFGSCGNFLTVFTAGFETRDLARAVISTVLSLSKDVCRMKTSLHFEGEDSALGFSSGR